MVLLPIILVCLYLQSASGKPVPTPANVTCSGSDEVAKLVNGKIVCWKLSSSCPMGYGLTVELGKVYPAKERISCDPCIEGSTFSDKDDFSQCKNCTRCWENEIPFGQCTKSKDSITCECKSGFYRTNDDFSRCTKCKTCGENELAIGLCTREKDNITCECKPGFYKPNDDLNQCIKCKTCGENELTIGLCTRENDNTTCECKPGYYRSPDAGHRCRHCTRCCGQADDDCSSPEAKKCSVLEIICPTIPTPSYSTPGSTVNMSSKSKVSMESKSNKSQEQHDPTGRIVLTVFCSIMVLISIIILVSAKFIPNSRLMGEKSSYQCYMVIGMPQQVCCNRKNSIASEECSSGSLESEIASNANHATPPQGNDPVLQPLLPRVTPAAAQTGNQNALQVTGLPSNNTAPQPQLPRVAPDAAQTGNQNAQVTGLPSNNTAPQPQLPRVTPAATQTAGNQSIQVTGLPSNNTAPQPQLPRVTAAAAQAGNQNVLQVTGLPSNNPAPQPQLPRVTPAQPQRVTSQLATGDSLLQGMNGNAERHSSQALESSPAPQNVTLDAIQEHPIWSSRMTKAVQTGTSLIDEKDHEIPNTGSDESTYIVPALINIADHDHSYLDATTWTTWTQVTDLPEDICNVLDEEDPFYRDYRMFAEELGMDKSEIKILSLNKSPTHTLLKKYKVTFKTFLEVIKTIIQCNAGIHQKLANVKSRTDNLVQISEDVKSWLDRSTVC